MPGDQGLLQRAVVEARSWGWQSASLKPYLVCEPRGRAPATTFRNAASAPAFQFGVQVKKGG